MLEEYIKFIASFIGLLFSAWRSAKDESREMKFFWIFVVVISLGLLWLTSTGERNLQEFFPPISQEEKGNILIHTAYPVSHIQYLKLWWPNDQIVMLNSDNYESKASLIKIKSILMDNLEINNLIAQNYFEIGYRAKISIFNPEYIDSEKTGHITIDHKNLRLIPLSTLKFFGVSTKSMAPSRS